MPKRPDFEPFQRGDRWVISIPPSMTATGKRVRKIFVTKTAAEKFGAKYRASHASGVRGSVISATLAIQAQEAQRILEGTGISLVEAAKQAAAKVADKAGKEIFADRYDRAVLAGEGYWSARYRSDMEKIPRWAKGIFSMPCGMINRDVIETALLKNGPLARSTLDMRLARVDAVLGFKERHRRTATIKILSVKQAASLLRACESKDEVRAVAMLLFAGVRPDSEHGEISKIDWSDVQDDHIIVRPESSKTGTDRLIPITPRLARLIRGHSDRGAIAPFNWKRRWQRIRKTAGITGQDLTRHTFASHFLAAFGEHPTKQAMGHTAGSETLFRHYRRAVTEEAGKAYFE
jgi:integrase